MNSRSPPPYVLEPLAGYREWPPEEMRQRAAAFHRDVARRRSVREFDTREVPRAVIDDCLRSAGKAPSGANQQPWFFSVITDPDRKRRVREAGEGS
jgi:iodotyrosine deiodinase